MTSIDPNLAFQLLITGADLYMQLRREGRDLDGKSKEQMRQKLREVNQGLGAIPDLPTGEDQKE